MGETSIEWTRGDDGTPGMTWNPVRGCSRVSEGCRNCYAERIAARFSGPGKPFEGLAQITKAGARWTGKTVLVESALLEPLKWRNPRRVFVNSMSDLFHESLSFYDIERVFAVMALARRHTFQILTKRPERMLKWFTEGPGHPLATTAAVVATTAEHIGKIVWDGRAGQPGVFYPKGWENRRPWPGWPLPNVWLGVSVEDQATADERIPLLLQAPAAIRFLSCEPLLGPIDFAKVPGLNRAGSAGQEIVRNLWVIAGGESGAGARPSHPDWFRSLRDQCVRAGVPYFFKQWGSHGSASINTTTGERLDPREFRDHEQWVAKASTWVNGGVCVDRKGRVLRNGLDFARARDEGAFPVAVMHRMGKKAAGRLLDGVEWNQMPKAGETSKVVTQ